MRRSSAILTASVALFGAIAAYLLIHSWKVGATHSGLAFAATAATAEPGWREKPVRETSPATPAPATALDEAQLVVFDSALAESLADFESGLEAHEARSR